MGYTKGFFESLENFEKGTSKLHSGKLKEDLYLVNCHDKNKILGAKENGRTMEWATHLEVYNRIPTTKEIHQHLALVKPDWGERNTIAIIWVPKGTDITFISGKALVQPSKSGDIFKGGAFQIRFRDFDMKWIVSNRPILK